METIKFVKTFECQVPVWVDGVRTDEVETRIKALFRRDTKALGGLVAQVTHGSLFLSKDATQEDIERELSTDMDYSKELKFVPIEGSDFYKVVAR